MLDPIIKMENISKRFGAVRALQEVDLEVMPGEVHALIGENGAGTSTLMKILSGAHQPDKGTIFYRGRAIRMHSPAEVRARGVAMIYQELTLAPHLTVAENITLGIEESSFGFIRRQTSETRAALELLGHGGIDLDTPVSRCGMGEQQVVEIARALMVKASVIILDEPTSSLSAADTEKLFRVIREVKKRGVAVIYISHFLEEVEQIADCYTVLRDGETVGTGRMNDTTLSVIVRLMVGRTLKEMFPRAPHGLGEIVLDVDELSGSPIPEGVSLKLRRGEIMGIAGLVASGRSELLRVLFGLDRARRGNVKLRGKRIPGLRKMQPRRALGMGLDFLSENRKEEGLATNLSVRNNVTLSSLGNFTARRGTGLINIRKEAAAVAGHCQALGVRCRDVLQKVQDLSGGNQQKVAIARILAHGSNVLFLDEPTRGIDVGSKIEIYRLIGERAAAGDAVIMVSSYLPELFGICDTLAVMYRGRLSPVKPVSEWSEDEVMVWATSGK